MEKYIWGLVVALACVVTLERWTKTAGVDFYHYWGVTAARTLSDDGLSNPYEDTTQFSTVLNAYVERSHDGRLRAINQHRRELDLTGTPLFYATFFFLPLSYSFAFGMYQACQTLCIFAAAALLGRNVQERGALASLAAILLLMPDGALQSELRVGNVNAFQLFVIAATVALAHRMDQARDDRVRGRIAAALFSLPVALTLWKPNLLLIAIALTLCFVLRMGPRRSMRACLPAIGVGGLLLAAPCLYFGDWGLWGDWYHDVLSADHTRLMFLVESGNFSSTMLLSQLLDAPSRGVSFGIAGFLVLSLGAVFVYAGSRPGDPPAGVLHVAHRSFRDIGVATALGVTATCALMPLMWFHYYILSLVPAFWLLLSDRRTPNVGILGAISIALSANAVGPLCFVLGLKQGEPYWIALCWVPLWMGALRRIARHSAVATDSDTGA